MQVTAALVKELREKTGAGMMDCKKALVEVEGDMAKAIDWLREKGIAKAAKKSGRVAAEGLTRVVANGNKAVVIEMNSETDFVAKNEAFLKLIDEVANTILSSGVKTIDEANALPMNGKTVADCIIDATATIGEKITLRRFEVMEKEDADIFGAYVHMGGKISVACVLKNTSDAALAKDIAMQIASMAPSYVSRADMPAEVVAHETEVQQEILKNDEKMANKPEKILKGIIEGRVSKALQDMCLVDQEFFKDSNLKVNQVLTNGNTSCAGFVRYAVGEGIEKKEDNFAEEVMSQING